jgi:ADP-ribosylglycohydrolase
VRDRIRGLMWGTALGDALGGPIEFQSPDDTARLPDPPKRWGDEEVLDASSRRAAQSRLRLRSYSPLRPKPESYGQWNADAPAGTVTDDTRFKLILIEALAEAERAGRWPFGLRDYARAFLEWPKQAAVSERADYRVLAADWLEEWHFAARWILGERDLARARPPERMWTGLPTCSGQMALLPLAAVFAGDPDGAYRAAWQLGFFDNGWAKDLNAALVAGLAVALVTPLDPGNPRAAWHTVRAAIRNTDPFGHGKIRWTERAVNRWLDMAERLAREADGRPARMFAAWDREFRHNSKWEAQVPVVVAFGALALTGDDPLAAWQLALEWGWDTDSDAQLLGAFIGALHGPDAFAMDWRAAVAARLQADFRVSLRDACELLDRLRLRAQSTRLVEVDR